MSDIHSTEMLTREQRAAIAFEPLPVFDWTNEKWAETFLPIVRLASLFLAENRADLRARVKGAIDANNDVVPSALEDMGKTRDHLESLVTLLDAAISRTFLVLEDLGQHNEDDYTAEGKWKGAP